jgi:aerobic carbon-monoxide dehydrogenase small subunit
MTAWRATVNAQDVHLDIADDWRLSEALHRGLQINSLHQACDTAQCGSCTIALKRDHQHVAIKACNVLALQVNDAEILTVEGLEDEQGNLHPLQQAFLKHQAFQCGFCTPGMLMRGMAILDDGQAHTKASVARALEGNLCRCTGYDTIVSAIMECLGKRPAKS